MHGLFEGRRRRTPEAVALVGGDGALPTRELDGQASRLARRLRRLGVGPDVPVVSAWSARPS